MYDPLSEHEREQLTAWLRDHPLPDSLNLTLGTVGTSADDVDWSNPAVRAHVFALAKLGHDWYIRQLLASEGD